MTIQLGHGTSERQPITSSYREGRASRSVAPGSIATASAPEIARGQTVGRPASDFQPREKYSRGRWHRPEDSGTEVAASSSVKLSGLSAPARQTDLHPQEERKEARSGHPGAM